MWLGDAFVRFAQEAGLEELEEFARCIAANEPVPSIEADILAAAAVGARGTPTIIVNGVH